MKVEGAKYLRTMLSQEMHRLIEWALEEDRGECDHTSASSLPPGLEKDGWIIAKQAGVVAGLEVARAVFSLVDDSVRCDFLKADGDRVEVGEAVCRVTGSARSILEGERLALNFIQRMSGIATRTSQVMATLVGTKCQVLDTRKTTPGIRAFEKWAVVLGGGANHRMGLYDMILIKDNHIDFAGSMEQALNRVQSYLEALGRDLPVVVEVRNAKEAAEAMQARNHLTKPSGATLIDRLLLDNHTPNEVRKMVAVYGNHIPLEASGGITPENAREYALAGVDFISMGYLTHSVPSLDFSMKSSIQGI